MKTFKNYEELRTFLTTNTIDGYAYYGGGPLDAQFFGSTRDMAMPAPTAESGTSALNGPSYSTTNIQVAGVDEADIVKTDGKYIYVATNNVYSSGNTIYILKADPQDPRVIAKIALNNDTYVAGLFLSQDSNKLVVLGSQYQVYTYGIARPEVAMIYPYYSDVYTFINVYEISEKTHPALERNLTLSGSYFNSRMIGDYVYAVVSQPAYLINNDVILPKVYQNTHTSEIALSRIYYADTVDSYFTFTTFIGLNILNGTQEPTSMTVMMGGASNMYVSLNNIYVTYPTWSSQGQYTSIYRIRVNGGNLTFEAKGNVTGYVLNQYSMDEYNGYFRLATTSQANQTQQNNVYVLNIELTTVGRIENLAKDERIYSARFMGNKAYLVTFRQIDPFFVLDLSSPTAPKVAGELKIPGFSSYLHPYDENYVIGIGREDRNVKLSLFDVTNVNEPKEVGKDIIEGDWTDSQALQDPHAFLFDKDKQLLVLPISIMQYGVIDITGSETSVQQGGFWQGAYVFKLNLGGFTLRGGITHQENTTSSQYYGVDYSRWVNRALTIEDTLYTVSNAKVKLNSLIDLALIAEIVLR
jgi:uncharacterized secreted protein with C-terminal beta-propeller domain